MPTRPSSRCGPRLAQGRAIRPARAGLPSSKGLL
jgi:hypothetical protein